MSSMFSECITWCDWLTVVVADGGVRRRRLKADSARSPAALRQAEGQRKEPQTLWAAWCAGIQPSNSLVSRGGRFTTAALPFVWASNYILCKAGHSVGCQISDTAQLLRALNGGLLPLNHVRSSVPGPHWRLGPTPVILVSPFAILNPAMACHRQACLSGTFQSLSLSTRFAMLSLVIGKIDLD